MKKNMPEIKSHTLRREHLHQLGKNSIANYLPPLFDRLGIPERGAEGINIVIEEWMKETYKRSLDVTSPELEVAREQCKDFFGVVLYSTLCMDRRTKSVFEYGRPPKYGGAARYQGAKPPGILRTADGIYIDQRTSYWKQVQIAMERTPDAVHHHDSHLGCAAKGDEETTRKGQLPEDHGLLPDVEFRRQMMKALKDLGKQKTGVDASMVMTSFDPHNGDMIIGLNGDIPMSMGKELGVFSPQLIKHLKSENIVLSTTGLRENQLKELFDLNHFKADFVHDYRNSMKSFWIKLNSMKGEAIPIIRKLLDEVIVNSQLDYNEAEKGALVKIALANAFFGSLSYDANGKYKFDDHNESLGLATTGEEYGPFAITHLTIDRDSENLSDHLRLVQAVVRGARLKGKGTVTDVDSPVPLVIASRIDEIEPDEAVDWVQQIKWVGMNNNDSARENAQRVIERNPRIPYTIVKSITDLASVIDKLSNQNDSNSSFVYEGNIVPVPVLTTDLRGPISVVPLYPKRLA